MLSLAVAFIAWVTGPGRRAGRRCAAAPRARSAPSAAGGERVGIDTGGFGIALGTYKTPIRVGVLGVALLLYVMRDHPTGGVRDRAADRGRRSCS